MIIPDYTISKFLGLNTNIKDIKTLKPGISPDSLNWITGGKEGDHIELRRGQALLGQTRNTDINGKITGLAVGMRYDGVELPFYSFGRKVKYYDSVADDNIEVGTDLLPTEASGNDIWMEKNQGISGSFIYLGCANSSVYKIPVANPGNAVDQNVTDPRFGVFHIGLSRSYAGQKNTNKTGLHLSYIDKARLSLFTKVTAEAYATGDGSTKTFTHDLSAISTPKTAMLVNVTDGTETFNDNMDGVLIGDKGGTGTVNYATGDVSVTFNTAPTNSQAITCTYYHETSTSGGLLDFTGTNPTEGQFYPQGDGSGNLMAIFNLNLIDYCFHKLKTYQFTQSLADTTNSNLPYRNIGIPYSRAAWQTPEGIIFADLARPTDPKFRRLEVLQGTSNTTIEPKSISDSLDLSIYDFDYCVAFRWGDYEIFCVQEKTSSVSNTFNSLMFIRNVLSGAWDVLDYYASNLAEYMGTLIAGDSISNNAFTLFSGFDDDGDIINNFWTSSDLNLNTDNLKVVNFMEVDGLIQKGQSLKVSLSYDGGAFSEIYTILGDGAYVDSGINTTIGATTIGSKVLGGGGGETAHPFELRLPVHSDKFIFARIKIEALGIGHCAVNSFKFVDIRDKGQKNLPVRTV